MDVIQEIFRGILDRPEEELETWGIAMKLVNDPDRDRMERDFYVSLDSEQRKKYDEVEQSAGFAHLDECEQRFEQGFRIGFYLAWQLRRKMK